jgi:Na+-transporting NADH:ubiquinone oxidoreductase subunit B
MSRIRALRLFAIAPVLIAAVINTGHQYLLALDVNDGEGVGDWRDGALQSFGLDYTDPGAYDMVVAGLIHVLPVFIMAFLTAGVWERVFAANRGRRFDTGVVYTVLLFTLLMPAGVSLFHVVFGMSFAMVFAKGIFGGEGRSFLNPALVGVAILQVSFPTALTNHPLWTNINGYAGTRALATYHEEGLGGLTWMGIDWWGAFLGNIQGLMGTTSVLAVMIGGAVLIYGGIASWRLLAGQLIGVFAVATLCNMIGGGVLDLSWSWHVVLGSLAFGAVFIATDPSSSATTNVGRWVQGILMGALVVFIRVVNPSHPDGVIPILLLGSMLAPLIDHIVVWFNIRRRALGQGVDHG